MAYATTLPGQLHPTLRKKRDASTSRVAQDLAKSTVIDRAIEVIGRPSEAMRWLGTPVRALDYATPISLLHNSEGRNSVLEVLGRLEHGVL